MNPTATGIDRNLTHYADPGFSRYLRRAFLASAGYDEADLERPVVGIADNTAQDGDFDIIVQDFHDLAAQLGS